MIIVHSGADVNSKDSASKTATHGVTAQPLWLHRLQETPLVTGAIFSSPELSTLWNAIDGASHSPPPRSSQFEGPMLSGRGQLAMDRIGQLPRRGFLRLKRETDPAFALKNDLR